MAKCTPCLNDRAKEVLIAEFPHLNLDSVPSCKGSKELDMCVGIKSRDGRGRSKYQQYISECMKGKNIKGFNQAPQAMRECASNWNRSK